MDVSRRRAPAMVLGVPVADLTLAETVDAIASLVADGRKHGRTHQICTVNVDFLVNARADAHVGDILRRATICLPDGKPVVWASRLLGTPIRERVAGADLVPLLVEQSAVRGWRVHLFGSSPDVARRAESTLRERFPTSRVTLEPGPRIVDANDVDDRVLDGIASVDADIVCVALGNPKQELFIDAHRDRLGVPVMIGVGGSIDMLVGEQRRAPSWMQRVGLEWLWRAGSDPRRLAPRYARDLRVFAPALAADWWCSRKSQAKSGLRNTVADGCVEIDITGEQPLAGDEYRSTIERLHAGCALRISGDGAEPSRQALAQLVGLVAAAGGSALWSDPTPPTWLHRRRVTPALLGWSIAAIAKPRPWDEGAGYHGEDGE